MRDFIWCNYTLSLHLVSIKDALPQYVKSNDRKHKNQPWTVCRPILIFYIHSSMLISFNRLEKIFFFFNNNIIIKSSLYCCVSIHDLQINIISVVDIKKFVFNSCGDYDNNMETLISDCLSRPSVKILIDVGRLLGVSLT